MTIPLKNIFFKIFKFYQPSKEYLEIEELYDNIKSNDEMSLKEIDFHKKKLISYLENLLIAKGFINKECLDNYFFISNYSFEYSNPHYVSIQLSLNFNSCFDSYANHTLQYFEVRQEIKSLRQYKFFDYFATIIEDMKTYEIENEIKDLKNKIMILEQEQAKEKIPTCDKNFACQNLNDLKCYQNVSYQNLNDLNSAKFLTDNEKRMILGLKPINNENK